MSKCMFQDTAVNGTYQEQVGNPIQPNFHDLVKLYFDPKYALHRENWAQKLLITLYAAIGGLGFLMNTVVVVLILYHRAVYNITNVFVLVLALSDMFMCSFNIPLQILYDLESMPVNDLVCKVIFVSFALPLHVSSLTMMYIAIDRYRIIIHPLVPRMSLSLALSLVLGTLVYSLLHGMPVAWAINVQKLFGGLDTSNVSQIDSYCVELWSSAELRLAFSVHNTAVLFFLPLLVTSVLYARVYCRLRSRAFRKRHTKRKRRTNKILVAIVLCFTVCWLPWTVVSFLQEVQIFLHSRSFGNYDIEYSNCTEVFNEDANSSAELAIQKGGLGEGMTPILGDQRNIRTHDLMMKLLAVSSCLLNSFLYGWLNDSIRESFRRWRGLRHSDSCRIQGGENFLMHPCRSLSARNLQPHTGDREDNVDETETGHNSSRQRMLQLNSSRYSPSLFEASTKRTSLSPSGCLFNCHSPRNSLMAGGSGGDKLLSPMSLLVTNTNHQNESPVRESVIHHEVLQHHLHANPARLPTTANCNNAHSEGDGDASKLEVILPQLIINNEEISQTSSTELGASASCAARHQKCGTMSHASKRRHSTSAPLHHKDRTQHHPIHTLEHDEDANVGVSVGKHHVVAFKIHLARDNNSSSPTTEEDSDDFAYFRNIAAKEEKRKTIQRRNSTGGAQQHESHGK